MVEVTRIIELLQVFEKASGQQINYSKSSAFFSTNSANGIRRQICDFMGIKEADTNSHYLGLPSMMGRNKNVVLGYLKERIEKRIHSWDSKLLSKAGKEILIKSVVQSLPSYAMNVFLLTKELCQAIERKISQFWWSSKSTRTNGISWKSWANLSKHKNNGGMGFKNLRDFNLSLLGKQGFRLLTNEKSLVAQIFKARYYSAGNYLTAELGPNPSFIWRSVFEAKEVVSQGVRRCIGTGLETSILRVPWLPDEHNGCIESTQPALEGSLVRSLMELGGGGWDDDILQDLFTERDKELIYQIPLGSNDNHDSWYWLYEKNGVYSVKSAYKMLQKNKGSWSPSANSGFWRGIWQLKVPPKVKNMNCWRLLFGAARASAEMTFSAWWQQAVQTGDREEMELGAVLCWVLWKIRNELVWNKINLVVNKVVFLTKLTLNQYRSAQERLQRSSSNQHDDEEVLEQWTKPQIGMIKVNVDGALFDNEGYFGFGMVARGSEGGFIEAFQSSSKGRVIPNMVEALGIKEALSWIKRKGWSKVILESDCLNVVNAIKSTSCMVSPYGLLIQECKQLLSKLNDVCVMFVKRSANKVAHNLARAACFKTGCTISRSDVPTDCLSLLLKDIV
ncbi:uncharacterized protein LOC133823623 [Humulus lupulus]|uniref:uncharacterized protein LOC133823623 n=1 Tax=Humulus lupulus TaxID=3486 RepID=UPI002B40C7F9|nr:uncharacterized protein LOC133823623 [Humulus lupulus]